MPDKVIVLPKGTKVPNHMAIILDGNRRWARARGLHTLQGHKAGFDAARRIAKVARGLGIHTLTVWGFSTENWDRSKEEIDYLMRLYWKFVKEVRADAKKDGVRFVHVGRKDRFPQKLVKFMEKVEEETKNNTKHVFNAALDYGGRDEIVRAAQKIIRDGVAPEKITEDLFASYLDTANQPYPYVDLFIRTSGEQRTSGFLSWQMAYAEYYWELDHLPDFTAEKLRNILIDYSRRRRRFGGNDIERHLKFRPEVSAKFELAWWRLKRIPEGTKFSEYAMEHIKEQYGLSKELAKEAGTLMTEAILKGEDSKWEAAKRPLKKFYRLIRDELKLAFEPSLAAFLEVKLWQEMNGKERVDEAVEVEETAREYYAEVYRISLLQAAKAAHLRVLAGIERNLAERGYGDHHWQKAEDYLQKFYSALKERVA